MKILSDYGVPAEFAAEHYYSTAGAPILEQFKTALAKFEKNYSDEFLKKELVDKFFKISRQTKPLLFIGVKNVLQEIKKRELILIATSGSNTAELKNIFREHDLPYDDCLGSDSHPKGDKHISLMARYYNCSLSDFCKHAVYVGDGPTDMEIAKRNNIFAIGITNTVSAEKLTRAGAKEIITRFEEILDLI